jgi:multidrug efflux pump subunit AcrA (membrane-fusion protein)
LLLIGILPRLKQSAELAAEAAAEAKGKVAVDVARPSESPSTTLLNLPGTIEAVEQTGVNARATGYANQVLVDIGDKVKAGQTLAIISAPDTDQQTVQGRAELSQAETVVSQAIANVDAMEGALAQQQANVSHSKAAYLQAEAQVAQDSAQLASAQFQYNEQEHTVTEQSANKDLADVTNQRYQYLLKEGAIAKQDADQTAATAKVNDAGLDLSQAALQSSQANIDAYKQNVAAGKANAEAAKQDIKVAQAQVRTAISNVKAAQAEVASAQANVNADQANLVRLADLQGFERVTAPFDGIVTARNIDQGAYISAGGSASASSSVGATSAGSSTSGSAAGGNGTLGSSSSSSGVSASLFTISSIQRLRIYLNLPQTISNSVQVGQEANISVASVPHRIFKGTVSRTAIALDPSSRTLVAEIMIDNASEELKPGMFGEVGLTVSQPQRILQIPDPALLTGPAGPQLVIIGQGNKLHFQTVTIGDDDGTTMQILSGLKLHDRVVAAPNYELHEGEAVQPQETKGAKGGRKHAPAS